MSLYLTEDANFFLLEQLTQSTRYDVVEIESKEVIMAAIKQSGFRHSSATRFGCLVDIILPQPDGVHEGRFFKVWLLDASSSAGWKADCS